MPRVAVIGAGIIGGSIAWRLAQAGLQVTLYDAGRFGGEASWAGAGMLSPGGEFERPSLWSELARESMALYPRFVDELRAESGMPIDFRICGLLELGSADVGEDLMSRRARFKEQSGIVVERRPDGVFYPDDGFIDPREMTAALRQVCVQRGVDLRENTRLAEFDCDSCTSVVLAAGAWSSGITLLSAGHRLALPESFPIKGHLISYHMPAGSLGPMRRRDHAYLLQRSSGLVIAGSNEERSGYDRSVDLETCRKLHLAACDLWPALEGKTWQNAWIGFRPATDTGLPALGRFNQTNVWLAYGHYRNGILLAPLTAHKIASEINAP